jgi:xanthine dehydrogenase YagS FAD-binding subunit
MNLFTHVNATTMAEATAAMAKGNTQAIGGGTDFLTYMRTMCSPNPPAAVVNLKTVTPSLAYIKEEGGMLKVGATTTLAAIAASSVVKGNYAALAQAAAAVAAPEIRNTATIAGNICQKPRCLYFRFDNNDFPCLRKKATGLCYALVGVNTFHSIFGAINGCVAPSPSDIAPVLVAMNATIITSKKAAGWKAADFFAPPADATATTNRREQINALDLDEIVTEIQIPTPAAGTKTAYMKWSFRKAIDFPLVSAAVVATVGGGNVSAASIVLGGVYGIPKVATAAQTAIVGKPINAANAAAAGDAAVTGATSLATPGKTPSNNYKLQITKVMVKKALMAVA